MLGTGRDNNIWDRRFFYVDSNPDYACISSHQAPTEEKGATVFRQKSIHNLPPTLLVSAFD